MSRTYTSPVLRPILFAAASLAMVVAAGCGTPAASAGDGAVNNPRNPAGLGPAAVELGLAASVGAPASYVILAKTGVTNVTGSTITGGNVGLSPAAPSF